jgi:hypothetical protein
MGHYTQAISYYQKALAIAPKDQDTITIIQIAVCRFADKALVQYENGTCGMRIGYPANWSVNSRSAIVGFYCPARDEANHAHSVAAITLGLEAAKGNATFGIDQRS